MRRWGCWLLLTLGTSAQARVFWKRPADIPEGWTRAHASDVRLQSQQGKMEIFVTPDSLQGVETVLRKLHGEDLVWVPGEVMGWGLAIQDGWMTRYLVQPLPESAGFWILSLRQPLRGTPPPGTSPSRHQLKAVPPYPQSVPTFFSEEADTRVRVEISQTTASPEAVLESLSERVRGAGWTPSPVNTAGFRTFTRGEEIAMLSAQLGKDGTTRILRLHKSPEVK
jgi:hypothetical protein